MSDEMPRPNQVLDISIAPMPQEKEELVCDDEVAVERWIFAPIAVTIQQMKMAKKTHQEHMPESKTSFLLQTIVPFLFAGLGLIMAGVMLERSEDSDLFTFLPDLVIMVPTLVGLKGNLEMTLSSRLSTLSNLGFMDTKTEILNVAVTNMALIQAQAIVVSSLAVGPVLIFGKQPITFLDTIRMLLAAISTASLASFVLSLLMVFVVIAARRYKLNPDNISTPVAASLGDVSTLFIFLAVGSFILKIRAVWILILCLALIYSLAVFGAHIASKDKFTVEVLRNGWWPIIVAMFITTSSGFVLKSSMRAYPPIAAFQPLINGIGGNLVAVQASRISTQLHRARKNREKEVKPIRFYFNPWNAFFTKSEDSIAAKLLIVLSIPSNVLFIAIIFAFGCGFSNTPWFTAFFTVTCVIQVSFLLYVCQIMVRAMWVLKVDPDNSAIPFLTALGDLLGSLLLIVCFWSQSHFFNLPVDLAHFDKSSRIH